MTNKHTEKINTKGKKHHGYTDTPTYKSWVSMKQRCSNPSTNGYENYGGRGITVCQRWSSSFENFLADMGDADRAA